MGEENSIKPHHIIGGFCVGLLVLILLFELVHIEMRVLPAFLVLSIVTLVSGVSIYFMKKYSLYSGIAIIISMIVAFLTPRFLRWRFMSIPSEIAFYPIIVVLFGIGSFSILSKYHKSTKSSFIKPNGFIVSGLVLLFLVQMVTLPLILMAVAFGADTTGVSLPFIAIGLTILGIISTFFMTLLFKFVRIFLICIGVITGIIYLPMEGIFKVIFLIPCLLIIYGAFKQKQIV
ncbi:hypothetical protein H6503_00580 [Candidatus Woesearchaeota archaeon]|nr:hypothetical protein [Candidatus Woesearchaeota archaeon]